MRRKYFSNKDELSLQIEQLWDDGRRSYEDLRDVELEILTGMIMQKTSPRDRLDFILEADNTAELPDALMNIFLGVTDSTPNDILGLMKKGATQYAKPRIDELFERHAELASYYEKQAVREAREELAYA